MEKIKEAILSGQKSVLVNGILFEGLPICPRDTQKRKEMFAEMKAEELIKQSESMKLTQGTEVIIKRYENSTYNIQDSIFDIEGNYITKQSNLNVRNRFKNKDFKHNGITLKAVKWERI